MSVIHDYSQLDDLEQEYIARRKAELDAKLLPLQNDTKRASAELRLKTGVALLCLGAGIGLACWGASYVFPPKIIEKPVVIEKVVYVDKPIITERVVTVEKPVIVEKLVRVPEQPAVTKPISRPQTEEQFRNQPDFKNAQYSGIIESYIGGDITFEGGRRFNHVASSDRKTRPDLVGRYGYCIMSNPAMQRYTCHAWIDGKQEPI